MSDLINRQNLLEIIDWYEQQYSEIESYLDSIRKDIKSLPSEQKIIRCKDCKHRIVNEHYGEKGYMDLKARCELGTDDIFQLGRNAENDDWFCADGERKADG